jgi:hypothetical protein
MGLGDRARENEWIKLQFEAYVVETGMSKASNKG